MFDKHIDLKRPKDRAMAVLVLIALTILFFAIRPTLALFTETRGIERNVSGRLWDADEALKIKADMHAVNSVLKIYTALDSTTWEASTLEKLTRFSTRYNVQVTGLSSPDVKPLFNNLILHQQITVKGEFKDLVKVLADIEESESGKVNAIAVGKENQQDENDNNLTLKIELSVIIK